MRNAPLRTRALVHTGPGETRLRVPELGHGKAVRPRTRGGIFTTAMPASAIIASNYAAN
jgi:hypothetical protein